MVLTDRCRRGLVHWAIAAVVAAAGSTAAIANDYPTATRVDYVLGCMAANGQDYLVMEKCSCSADVVADKLSYEQYERIETIMRMREGRGELGVMFRTSRALEDEVQAFRQAQIEADLQCF